MKQQRIIFKLVICLAFCFFFSKLGITTMAQETTCQSSIESFVSSINDNDWDSFKNKLFTTGILMKIHIQMV